MKRATNSVRGRWKISRGGALLFDPALVHHHDVVGERHRFFLAVGDLDEADAELALKPLQLAAHPHPQERIERGERLVEQQDLRLGDQCAGERDALLLAAGELGREPGRIGRHRHQLEQFAGALVPVAPVDAAHFEGKRHVVEHAQMRKQRVGLEHHRRAALGGLEVGDVLRTEMMSPSLTASWPAIIRKVEVLPQPEGPSRQQ